jgi:acyl carrier protein
MLMTVVLRDSAFGNLTQQHFDDVYQSKIAALNVIRELVDLNKIDFNLLFSTVGTVFGNAGQAAYLTAQLYLDKIAETLPNTISMSIPPIMDSGIFKALVRSNKGGVNTTKLSMVGMSTAQVCEFIGDSIIRRIPHYLPLLNHDDLLVAFDTCDPLLFSHLLPPQLLASGGSSKDENGESPATLLSGLLGLGIDQILDNALITSYGLDSLAATRFSSQLKSAFGINVSQIELLGSMTIGMLDEIVAKSQKTESDSDTTITLDGGSAKYGEPLVPILNDRLIYDEPYTTDASPHQYRTWLAQVEHDNRRGRDATVDQAMKSSGAAAWGTHGGYFITVDSKIPIDLGRMTKAFEETVNRHGSLRTRFHWDEEKGKLMQTIHPSVDVHNISTVDLSEEPNAYKVAYDMSLSYKPVPKVDQSHPPIRARNSLMWLAGLPSSLGNALSHLSTFLKSKVTRWRRSRRQEGTHDDKARSADPSSNLNESPLISFVMFALGNESYAFNITAHHMATDEASLGIFLRDLLQIYTDGPGSLPPVQLHYSDFSDWLIRTADRRAELRDEQLKYWSKKLDGVQPLVLTLSTPSEVEKGPIGQIKDQIDSSALKRYNDHVAVASATSFAAFFAAYNILLYKHSSQNSFVVGTATTQRSVAQLQEVVGFFTSVLPVRTTIQDEMTFAEYLEVFRDDLADDLSNDDVTLEDIISHTKTSPQDGSHPKHLFASGLDMRIANRFGASDITAAVISLPSGGEKYELSLTVHHETGEVILRFDNRLYTEGTARQFLGAYCGLIDTLGKNPHVKIGAVSVVSGKEQSRLAK